MKKLLIITSTLLMFCGCSKKNTTTPSYAITLTVTGQGNYNYQIGSTIGSGHSTTSKVITGTAVSPDLILLTATPDSVGYGICVELDSNPVLGGGNYKNCGGGKQTVQYQLQ